MNQKSTATLAKAQQQLKEALRLQKGKPCRIEINVRVSAKEKADWDKLAKDLDTTLSALVRTSLNGLAHTHTASNMPASSPDNDAS